MVLIIEIVVVVVVVVVVVAITIGSSSTSTSTAAASSRAPRSPTTSWRSGRRAITIAWKYCSFKSIILDVIRLTFIYVVNVICFFVILLFSYMITVFIYGWIIFSKKVIIYDMTCYNLVRHIIPIQIHNISICIYFNQYDII